MLILSHVNTWIMNIAEKMVLLMLPALESVFLDPTINDVPKM